MEYMIKGISFSIAIFLFIILLGPYLEVIIEYIFDISGFT